MAKILPIHGELAGSISGTTFARNKGGAYVRAKAKGTNRNSIAQQRARNGFGNASAAWAALTQQQKDLWNDAARQVTGVQPFGSASNLTGHQLFVGYNAIRRGFSGGGGSPVTSPPTAARPGVLTTLAIVVTETLATLTYTPTPVPNSGLLMVYQTKPHLPGRTPRRSEGQFCGRTGSPGSPQSVTLHTPMLVGQTSRFFVAIYDTTNLTFGPFMVADVTRLI